MASRGVCVLVVCCEASRYEGILLGTTRVRERNTFPTAIGTFVDGTLDVYPSLLSSPEAFTL